MESTVSGRAVIDIIATAIKQRELADSLPGMHALSGCDTTSYVYGIGKITALNVLASGMPLSLLGSPDADFKAVLTEASRFMSHCYNVRDSTDMSSSRYLVWIEKMSNTKIQHVPKLKSLPPTSEAFELHVHRAHLQTMIWKASLSSSPPVAADPLIHGWTMNNSSMFAVMLPPDVDPLPIEVLQMVRCGCSSDNSCSIGRCSCVNAQMSCSMFCKCRGRQECHNKHTKSVSGGEDNDDGDDDIGHE